MKRKISLNIKDEQFAFEEDTDLVNQLFHALGAALAEIQVFTRSTSPEMECIFTFE